jgi:hypothetical protein
MRVLHIAASDSYAAGGCVCLERLHGGLLDAGVESSIL